MHNHLTTWVSEHTWMLSSMAVLSVAMLLLSIFVAPWIVAQLPEDYLLRTSAPLVRSHSVRILIGTIRNIIALLLFLVGLIMLLAPGPGIIMLLLAVSMAQVPGKQKLIRQVATHKNVFQSLNWMRKRHNKPPFIHPDT